MLPGDQIQAALQPHLSSNHGVFFQADLAPDAGGPPLARILVSAEAAPVPHWHFVTCGLSASRFVPDYPDLGGIELRFRLARAANETTPPKWVADFLQRLSREAFSDERPLKRGSAINLAPLLEQSRDTDVTSALCVADPLGVQVVVITPAEYQRVMKSSDETTRARLALEFAPGGISDLARAPRRRPQPRGAPVAPPAPPVLPKVTTLSVKKDGNRLRLQLDASETAAFSQLLLASVRLGRITLSAQGWTVHLAVEDIARSATWATTLALYFTLDLANDLVAALADVSRRGTPIRLVNLTDVEFSVC